MINRGQITSPSHAKTISFVVLNSLLSINQDCRRRWTLRRHRRSLGARGVEARGVDVVAAGESAVDAALPQEVQDVQGGQQQR